MGDYLTPQRVRVPNQGAFNNYIPLVEIFEATDDFAQLQTDINAFMAGLPAASGPQMPIIEGVHYQNTVASNVVQYSALLVYAFVGPGGPS